MFIKNGHLSWCPTLVEPCTCKMTGYVLALLVAVPTAIYEFWGSSISVSLSLLSDAWHVSSDSVVYGVAIYGNIVALKNKALADEIKRLWAVRNANVLITVATVTILGALWRAWNPEEITAKTMLLVAIVGMFANFVMYIILQMFAIEHEHGDHNHDHLHETTIKHTLVDLILSFVVVATASLMIVYPPSTEWKVDLLASVGICYMLIRIARKTKRKIREHGHHDHHHH